MPKSTKAPQERALRALSRLTTFTLKDASRCGLPRTTLGRLVKKGVFIKLARGIYSSSTTQPLGESSDFVVACRRFGARSVIGGLSALFHYGLVDVVPTQVWVLVPPSLRTSTTQYRLLRTSRNLSHGIVSRHGYRITSIERTLLDGLIFASKIGERIAIGAMIRALRQRAASEKKLFQLADKMGALSVLDRYWQSVLAGVAE